MKYPWPYWGRNGGVRLDLRKRALVAVLVFALGASMLFPTALAAEKAPNVSLVDVEGVPFNLTDYEGQVVMLDFFFLACEPCKELAHDLKDLYKKGLEDFEIISIDTFPADSDAEIKEYADNNGYRWRFAKDTPEGDAQKAYSFAVAPLIVIIDRDGYPTYRATGHIDADELEDEVDAALAGEAIPIEIPQIGLVGIAFIAGLASFFSPCSFPLLPGYITYYFKMKADTRKRREEEAAGEADHPVAPEEPEAPSMGNQVGTGLKMGSLSGFGIVLVYLVLGLIIIGLLLVGVAVSGKAIEYMKPIVGIILVVMGILTVMDVTINTGYITAPFRRLKERVRPRKGPQRPTFNATGLFLYGVGYGSASASCSAPIFIALAVTAVSTGRPLDAVVTFVVFLLSLWLLMAIVTILLTVSEERVKRGLMKHYIVIKKVTGVVFLVAGGYLLWLTAAAAGWI